MAKKPQYWVTLSYEEFYDLVQASKQIKEYKAEVQKYKEQVLALRIMQQECFEKLRQMEKLL